MHTNKQKIDVSIITVGMNHLKYLKELFNSLYKTNPPKLIFEVIYVDNCSTDGSVEFIKNNFAKVKIIVNKKTLGFGANNNLGVSFSKGDYIAIVNPDIVFLKDSLDELYNYLEKKEQDCIVAPQLLNPDYSIQYSVRGFMSIYVFLMRFLSRGKDETSNETIRKYLYKDIDYNKEQNVDWAIGAALFMKKNLFKKLNGFDDAYFLYFEDVDLCFRSWKMGYPVIYYPKSRMIHNHLRASAKFSKKTFFHFKSMFTFFNKHGYFVVSKNKTNNS